MRLIFLIYLFFFCIFLVSSEKNTSKVLTHRLFVAENKRDSEHLATRVGKTVIGLGIAYTALLNALASRSLMMGLAHIGMKAQQMKFG